MSNEKMILTKESILAIKDYDIQEVSVEKWNGTVRLRSLTGVGRDVFEKAVTGSSSVPGSVDISGLKAMLLAMTIVDTEDKLIFSEEDVAELNKKSGEVINMLFDVAQKMNHIGEEGIAGAEKNLEGDLSVNNGSDSPDSSAEGQ